LEIRDKAGLKNVVANHLSCLDPRCIPIEEFPIDESFLDNHLPAISHQAALWYADLVNCKVCGILCLGLSYL